MDIALDYYRIFEAVARHRSFTRAAEALVNSQPNLTRAVHNLEAELGCRLFLRSSRGVELTPEGEALYAHVTAAMEQLRAGEAELQRQRELRSGMVSIACSETALHAVLLQVLSRFHRENPAIRLRVSNQSAPEAIDALRSGLPCSNPFANRQSSGSGSPRSPVRTAGGDGAGLVPRGRRVQHGLPAGQRPHLYAPGDRGPAAHRPTARYEHV